MIDLIKKALYTGLGAAELTKEKIEAFAGELVNKGKLSENDMKKFVEEVLEKSEERKGQLKKQLERVSEETMKRMNLANREELQALDSKFQEEIASLERRLIARIEEQPGKGTEE